MNIATFLQELQINKENSGVSTGLNWLKGDGTSIQSYSPTDGKLIASCTTASASDYEQIVATAQEAYKV